jgi:hypothetical protein
MDGFGEETKVMLLKRRKLVKEEQAKVWREIGNEKTKKEGKDKKRTRERKGEKRKEVPWKKGS